MKKVVYVGSLLALVGISIVSCKKENIIPSSEGGKSKVEMNHTKSSLYYRYNDTMVIFNTVDDFDSVIASAGEVLYRDLAGLDYMCYAETLGEGDTSSVGDEFLDYVLNRDLIVQIGNYIYRINKPNQAVFALHVDKVDNYDDLVAENTSNENILAFTTDDNVFELLGEEVSDKAIGDCRSTNQSVDGWTEYANFIDVNNIYGNGTDKRYKFERRFMVRYDSWGVYKKLFTEFKHNEKWYGIWDETYFTVAYQVAYYVKNGGSASVQHFPLYPFATTPQTVNVATSNYEWYDDNKEIIHYRGSKCLKKFDLKAWCWMRNRETLKHNLVPSSFLRIYDDLQVWQ